MHSASIVDNGNKNLYPFVRPPLPSGEALDGKISGILAHYRSGIAAVLLRPDR